MMFNTCLSNVYVSPGQKGKVKRGMFCLGHIGDQKQFGDAHTPFVLSL